MMTAMTDECEQFQTLEIQDHKSLHHHISVEYHQNLTKFCKLKKIRAIIKILRTQFNFFNSRWRMDAILIDKRPFSHNLALDTSMKDTQHTT